MTNLLQETVEAVLTSNHSSKDIVFIGSVVSWHSCTWEEFQILANQEYFAGSCAGYVAIDLIIVFSDKTHLEREQSSVGECWHYVEQLILPANRESITNLFADPHGFGDEALASLNS